MTTTHLITDGISITPPAPIPNGAVGPDGVHTGLADYVAIATAAINRGLKITPVHPLEKRGVLYNWNKNPTTTLSEVFQHAKDFPDYNVGIVGRRGIGNHCFLDIDADGVTERIESETGRQMPVTYTVRSRPQSAPWKRHYYFRQTSYSVSRLRKEANRKNTTKWVTSENTGAPMHPTEYDLKGVGGGGLVVAAGSVRKDGEIYTVINDVSVADIPDWLVNWLVQDIAKYRSACAKERHERATKVAALQETEKAALQASGIESAFEISEADIFAFVNWRAGTFASLGVERQTIETLLIDQVAKFCAGGKAFVESTTGRHKIHQTAFNKHLKIGNASYFSRLGQKKRATLSEGLKLSMAPTRKGLLVAAMKKFPDRITAANGYGRLQEALSGTAFSLKKGKAGQKAVREVREAAGFYAERTREGWIWVRDTADYIT